MTIEVVTDIDVTTVSGVDRVEVISGDLWVFNAPTPEYPHGMPVAGFAAGKWVFWHAVEAG